MAIRKKGSRFKDRNAIRRMHREGYSLEQISGKTSITVEHIQYVLEKWDEDAEKAKSQTLIARQHAEELTRAMRVPAGNSVTLSERDQIKAELRREIMAELELQKTDANTPVTAKPIPAPKTKTRAPSAVSSVVDTPSESAEVRRKRKVLPDSDDADDIDDTHATDDRLLA